MTPTIPGMCEYTDPIGSPPQRVAVAVVADGDTLAARFTDAEEGDVLIPVEDMAGEFQPA